MYSIEKVGDASTVWLCFSWTVWSGVGDIGIHRKKILVLGAFKSFKSTGGCCCATKPAWKINNLSGITTVNRLVLHFTFSRSNSATEILALAVGIQNYLDCFQTSPYSPHTLKTYIWKHEDDKTMMDYKQVFRHLHAEFHYMVSKLKIQPGLEQNQKLSQKPFRILVRLYFQPWEWLIP